jgi:hypothetical protein
MRFETAIQGDTVVMTLHLDDDALGARFRDNFGRADRDYDGAPSSRSISASNSSEQ